jgi:hypothetical protein
MFGVPGILELLIIAAIVLLPILIIVVVVLVVTNSQHRDAKNPNLRPCPDCGNYVSVRAPSCPRCGCPFTSS